MPSKLQSIVLESVLAGVKTAVASETTDATRKDTMEITNAVVAEVAPIVANATNTEPLYQSRIVVTQVVVAVAGLAGVFGYVVTPEYRDAIIAAYFAILGVAGPLYTLYARIKTGLKPLGS